MHLRVVLHFCLLVSVGVMASDSLLGPKQIAALKSVADAVIAPDGVHIAHVVRVQRDLAVDEDGPSWAELYVWDAARGNRPFITGRVKVSQVDWTPDGAGISFVTKRGDDKHPSLYVIPLDGGEARPVFSHTSGVKAYSWSPDGKSVAFIAEQEKDPQKEKHEKRGFDQEIVEEELLLDQVWIADLANPDVKRRVPVSGSAQSVSWSPAGDVLVVAAAPTPLVDDVYMNQKVHIVAIESGDVRITLDTRGKLGSIRWSPDGRHLALTASADRHDPKPGRLAVADARTGEMRWFFLPDEGDVREFAWKDGGNLFYLWDQGVETALRLLTLDSGKTQDLLPLGGPAFSELSYAAKGKKLALTGETPRHPTEAYVWSHGEAQAKRITDHNSWLADYAFAKQEVVRYKARDGLELEGILIRPLNENPGQRYPLIVYVHGGPESHVRNGWLTTYSRQGQMAAALGMAVFYPNYRASTGRGIKFSQLDHGRPAKEEFDDLLDAARHFVRVGLADEKKIGITGGSYGGYATAWCATRYSEHFAAAVMFVGISNKISKQGTSDIYEEVVMVHDRKEIWDDWELFLKQSPIYHVQKARTPLLILHGTKDPRVPTSQSRELFRHVKRLGQAPVRLVLYPGERHGNRRAASRYDYSLRSLRWFKHYLLGEGGSPPSKDLNYDWEKAKEPPVKEVAAN